MKKKIQLKDFKTSNNLAEIKISYRNKFRDKTKVSCSQTAFNVLYPLYDMDTIEYQEQFYLLLLNRANYVLGWIKLSSGGTTGTVADPKVIFALALKTNASGIILSHNHPSCSMLPSQCDQTLTRKISEVGNLLEIKLLDHLIISPEKNFYSFADEGHL